MPQLLNQYILKKTIGFGGYGKVKLATNTEDEQDYAVKLIKYTETMRKYDIDSLYNEVMVQSKFDHPYISKIKEFGDKGMICKENGDKKYEVFYIVMELEQNGDIFGYFIQRQFSEKVARYYFRQLISGIKEMHSRGVCHRDLKPENLLLDQNFNLKIADFGFAKEFSGKAKSYLGTTGYRAPEIESYQKYDPIKADIFSTGVILFILVAKLKPFGKAAIDDHYYHIIRTGRQDQFWFLHARMKELGFYKDDFKDLINHLFESDPQKRYSVEQIQEHPWFNSEIPTQEEIILEFTERTEERKMLEEEKKKLPDKEKFDQTHHKYRGKLYDEENQLVGKEMQRIPEKFVPSPYNTNLRLCFENEIDELFIQLEKTLDEMESKYVESELKYKIMIELDIKDEETTGNKSIVMKLYQDPQNEEATIIEFIRYNCDYTQYYNFYQKINCLLMDDRDCYQQILDEENNELPELNENEEDNNYEDDKLII